MVASARHDLGRLAMIHPAAGFGCVKVMTAAIRVGSAAGHVARTPPAAPGTSTPCLLLRPETPSRYRSWHRPLSPPDRAAALPASHACRETSWCSIISGSGRRGRLRRCAPRRAAFGSKFRLCRKAFVQLLSFHANRWSCTRCSWKCRAVKPDSASDTNARHSLIDPPAPDGPTPCRSARSSNPGLAFLFVATAPTAEGPFANPQQFRRLHLVQLRCIPAAKNVRELQHTNTLSGFRQAHPPNLPVGKPVPTGQIVCYINRTYRVLPTGVESAVAHRAVFAYKARMSRGTQPRRLIARAPARGPLRLLSLGLLLRLSRP